MDDQFIELCQRFESQLREGVCPKIAQFLKCVNSTKQVELATALLELELQKRIERGESPTKSDYQDSFEGVDFEWAELFDRVLAAVGSSHQPESAETSVSQGATFEYRPQRETVESVELKVGRYRLGAVLGRGGAGVVHAAWDDALRRDVAIKIPHAHAVSDDANIERFLNEARLVAGLSHTAIVPVFDCGRGPDGRWFVVYELMRGGSLHDELRASKPTSARTLEVVTAIALGLQFAHQHGIYHRDLKPRNVLIDQQGRPRISDFGLAIHDDVLLHARDTIAGTPAYMSPEQARGDTHLMDGRSDIWSLGVIFYEMLTGDRPFRGDQIGILFELIEQKPPRPPRQIDPSIDREIERICLKCLGKSPTDRYLTAQDIIEDLDRWRASTNSSADQLSTTSFPSERRTVSPNTRWSVGRIVVLSLGLIAVGALGFVLRPDAAKQPLRTTEQTPQLAGMTVIKPLEEEVPRINPQPQPGEWFSLLQLSPEVLAQPDDMSNTHWGVGPAKNSLAIGTNHNLVLKFMDLDASSFELRLRYHQSNWTGGIGVYWGAQTVSGLSGTQLLKFQTVLSPTLMPAQKDRRVQMSWRQILMQHNGLMNHSESWRDELRDLPIVGDCELTLRIRDHQLVAATWNGTPLDQMIHIPANVPINTIGGPGFLGLLFTHTDVLVQDFSLRLPE